MIPIQPLECVMLNNPHKIGGRLLFQGVVGQGFNNLHIALQRVESICGLLSSVTTRFGHSNNAFVCLIPWSSVLRWTLKQLGITKSFLARLNPTGIALTPVVVA